MLFGIIFKHWQVKLPYSNDSDRQMTAMIAIFVGLLQFRMKRKTFLFCLSRSVSSIYKSQFQHLILMHAFANFLQRYTSSTDGCVDCRMCRDREPNESCLINFGLWRSLLLKNKQTEIKCIPYNITQNCLPLKWKPNCTIFQRNFLFLRASRLTTTISYVTKTFNFYR